MAQIGHWLNGRFWRKADISSNTELVAAGFKLVGESNVLLNPQDDHGGRNAEAYSRGHTDQFILQFQKPT